MSQPVERRMLGDPSPEVDGSVAPHADVVAKAATLVQRGRFGPSLALLKEHLARSPDAAELLHARAVTLSEWGRSREAMESLRAAEARGLSSFRLDLDFAQICFARGELEEAERRLRRALALDGSVAAAYIGLGAVLQAKKRIDEAIGSYERAYDLLPDRVDCLWQIAACNLARDDAVAAEANARRALSSHGDGHARSWTMLGLALARQERFEEAFAALEKADGLEESQGLPPQAFVLHANELLALGRIKEVLALYARYLPSHTYPGAHLNCGIALLMGGSLREGFPLYDFHWCSPGLALARPRLGRPEWRGQELAGKTVVLWADHGVGDLVQFVRFARELAARGGSVVLQVRSELRDFATDCFGLERVIVGWEELDGGFDFHIPTMSVAGALGTDLASIPAQVPYLSIPAAHSRRWRERLASNSLLKVGLVWACSVQHPQYHARSIPLEKLAPLFGVDGVQFYSLQKERRVEDFAKLGVGDRLIDLAPELTDFRDTTAAIDALDLVISIDTAVVHIAGALAKPVWLMLTAVTDFRWLTSCEDSPWYPTARLFRQPRSGQWDEVVSRIRAALQDAIEARKAGSPPSLVSRTLTTRSALAASELSPELRVSELCRVSDTRYGFMQYTPREQPQAGSLEWFGEWLQPRLDLIATLLAPGATVVESGSGIGAHALALAQMIGPAGQLLCFEAVPLLAEILANNLRFNGIETVTVIGRVLAGPQLEGDGAANGLEERFATSDTVDDLMLERLDLLKLNDGSAALDILDGAADTLWRLRPMVFASVAAEAGVSGLADRMKAYGYRCWRVETPSFVTGNFNRREADIAEGFLAVALVGVPEEADAPLVLQRLAEV
jgi:tetratricopeptide (TPR) repeat protein